MMRRREKFVITATLLTLGLVGVQLVSLEIRYLAVGVFMVLSYLLSGWALSDDLQRFELLTIVPFPALFAGAVSLFYFLLPTNLVSRIAILSLFGIGQYALLLTSNIYSVAKGRTIQLIHAAHAVAFIFTLLTSLLYANTIFSLKLPFYANGGLIGLVHWPLIFMSLWSMNFEQRIERRVVHLSVLMTLLLVELSMILSFLPLSVWNSALLVMAWLYIGLGILHNYLRGVLFSNTLREYSLVAVVVGVIFVFLFPLK